MQLNHDFRHKVCRQGSEEGKMRKSRSKSGGSSMSNLLMAQLWAPIPWKNTSPGSSRGWSHLCCLQSSFSLGQICWLLHLSDGGHVCPGFLTWVIVAFEEERVINVYFFQYPKVSHVCGSFCRLWRPSKESLKGSSLEGVRGKDALGEGDASPGSISRKGTASPLPLVSHPRPHYSHCTREPGHCFANRDICHTGFSKRHRCFKFGIPMTCESVFKWKQAVWDVKEAVCSTQLTVGS